MFSSNGLFTPIKTKYKGGAGTRAANFSFPPHFYPNLSLTLPKLMEAAFTPAEFP
ncbi:hypothetical protein BB561_005244 [Smittium simulii]|uniref:Uncharacterized protein n=1 Tax=Smittium simulii TaxID=133385 RepID=A0A2T9YBF5_9FUNG|nr:hypothetical protein BB561_005244 [Smittium simulii]